jgi:MFS family permease
MSRVARPPLSAFRNIALLSLAQAVHMSAQSITVVIAGLIGYSLAPDKTLATLPFSLQMVGTLAMTIPASLALKRFGRRGGFTLGAGLALLGASIAFAGVWRAEFVLLCLGHFIFGGSVPFQGFYRFAAADSAPPGYASRAISWTLAGGIVAAFAGPNLASATRDLFSPILFAGCYVAMAALSVLLMALLQTLRLASPRSAGDAPRSLEPPRPLAEILRQPKAIVAVLASAIGFSSMTFLMVATPLAMVDCNFSFAQAAFVIQWHALAMFAPSFFTGSVIARFGAPRVILAGVAANLLCLAMTLSGIALHNFLGGLVLLGLGWNFMYIGGTSLLTQCYTASEWEKTQAANDFLVYALVATASFASGATQAGFGWSAVNLVLLPGLLLVLIAIATLGRAQRGAHVPREAIR